MNTVPSRPFKLLAASLCCLVLGCFDDLRKADSKLFDGSSDTASSDTPRAVDGAGTGGSGGSPTLDGPRDSSLDARDTPPGALDAPGDVQDAPACSDQCAVGARKCDGDRVQECVAQSSGCRDFGPPASCPAQQVCRTVAGVDGCACSGRTCSNGSCVPTSQCCGCDTSTRRCSNDRRTVVVSVCNASDGSCTGERAVETCGTCKSCSNGECITDDRVNECGTNRTCMNGSCRPTCGTMAQICCTTGAPCASGLGCDFFDKVCRPCGANGQTCCQNDACNSGLICDGRCIPCGQESQRCCLNRQCQDAKNVCMDSNGSPKCLHCGRLNEVCCGVTGSGGICDGNLRCNAADGEMYFGICVLP